jgi:hypothetical protein
MKIFNDKNDEKVNFVDDNNALVGFDMDQHCCESFGWFLSSKQPTKIEEDDYGEGLATEGYQFDVNYFEGGCLQDDEGFEEGGMATFRLVKGEEEMFLTLHNTHNGYYSHGFEMKVGGEIIHDSSL